MDETGGVQPGDTAAGVAAAEVIPERGAAAFIAEFLGTLTLVFFITMVVSLFIQAPAAPGVPTPYIDWSVIGLVHLLVLFLIVQTLALISGAHVNPAITMGLATIRQIRWIDAGMYIVLQLLGGIAGAALTRLILGGYANAKAVHYGTPSIDNQFLHNVIWRGVLVEGIGAFFLVWAVVGVAVNPQAVKGWAGLVIGGTLGFFVMVAGPLTGGSINPARALGPAVVSGHFGPGGTFVLVYLLAPVVGGVIAAVGYTLLFLTPGKKGVFGLGPVG